jgi:WD40 repeat protein
MLGLITLAVIAIFAVYRALLAGDGLQTGMAIFAMAFEPRGSVLAVAGDGIQLWDFSERQLLRTLPTKGVCFTFAWSPDGRFIAAPGDAASISIWNVGDGKRVRSFGNVTSVLHSIAWNPDGALIAAGGSDKTIRIWRAVDGTELQSISIVGDPLTLVFSADSRALTVGLREAPSVVVRVADGQLLDTLSDTDFMQSMALSPDGIILATGGKAPLKLWNGKNWQLLRSLEGHTDSINSVAFSPDGSLIVSSSGSSDSGVTTPKDTSVRLWRARDGLEVGRFDAKQIVRVVTFSPDGRTIILGYDNGLISFLPTPSQ